MTRRLGCFVSPQALLSIIGTEIDLAGLPKSAPACTDRRDAYRVDGFALQKTEFAPPSLESPKRLVEGLGTDIGPPAVVFLGDANNPLISGLDRQARPIRNGPHP